MKYILPFVFFSFGLFYSCADDNKAVTLEREQAQKVNDSILNIIHNHWSFNIPEASPIVKGKIVDWQKWNTFVSELNQKPTKSITAYRTKLDNLTKLSDELKTTVPIEISTSPIQVRLNNLNTNIKHLNSFMSLQTIPTQKVENLSQYIKSDIIGINNQIEEFFKIKNIPTENGEKELIKKLADTTRRANFDFENTLKDDHRQEALLDNKLPLKQKKGL